MTAQLQSVEKHTNIQYKARVDPPAQSAIHAPQEHTHIQNALSPQRFSLPQGIVV